MQENRKLLVGLDLGNDFTLLSCFDENSYEPIPIGEELERDVQELIPTAAAIIPASREWIFGKKALQSAQSGEAALLHDIVEKTMLGQQIMAGNMPYTGKYVLEKYFRYVLSRLKQYYPSDTILKLVITVEEKNRRLMTAIEEALAELGIGDDRLVIQSHKQSYMYYALSQNKDLWAQDVAMFEYTEKGLKYFQITVDRSGEPLVAGVSERDLSHIIDYGLLSRETPENLSHAFANSAKTILYRQLISTIYVTGVGFEGDWADDALRQFCFGRRVFKGQNLYTKGACYAARELSGRGKLNCIFLDDDMISSDITMRVYTGAAMVEHSVVKAGTPWYDIDESIDVIPDDEDEVQITIHDLMRKEKRTHLLSLVGIKDRANKMTRFRIRIRFSGAHTCVMTLKDNGFGDFAPTSNRIWEKTFEL